VAFRGRTDVYPVRWEKKDGSKAGNAPACGNEWKDILCDKKRVKCSECGNRLLLPLPVVQSCCKRGQSVGGSAKPPMTIQV
jgi:hypothetical protein